MPLQLTDTVAYVIHPKNLGEDDKVDYEIWVKRITQEFF